MHIKFGDSRFRRSVNMIAGVKIENRPGVVCHLWAKIWYSLYVRQIYRFRDIIGDPNLQWVTRPWPRPI